MSGLWAGILKESGRFSDVQSRTNCVRMPVLAVLWSKLQLGWTLATVLRRSGRSLLLTSLVALQTARTCSIESTGAWQRLQAGLRLGWSRESFSFVMKSHVKNLRWR